MKEKISEATLASQLLEYLKNDGWDCYPEALLHYGNGRADIAALKEGKLWILEVKNTLSLRLLEQAIEWAVTKAVNRVSVVTPIKKITPLVDDICKWKSIGIMTIHSYSGIKNRIVAPDLTYNDSKLNKNIESLHPDMKNYQPGTSNGYSTPYNRTMKVVKEFILQNPGSTLSNVVAGIQHHYSSKASAKSGILSGILRGDIEGIRAIQENNTWILHTSE